MLRHLEPSHFCQNVYLQVLLVLLRFALSFLKEIIQNYCKHSLNLRMEESLVLQELIAVQI